LRKIKNRLLDTAYAATQLQHQPTSDEQLAADEAFAQLLNLDAERRDWGIRWDVTREVVGIERVRVQGGTRGFNVTRIALRLVQLWPGAIDEAALAARALKPVPSSMPWLFLWLFRLGLEPLVDPVEFRDRAAEEYRRVRKNAVGADFEDIRNRIEDLDRDAARVREEWRNKLAGHAAVLDYALIRQGIDGAVPAFWPGGAVPRRQYHHISRIPLREYPVSGSLRLKAGGELLCFRQKGGPTRPVPVAPALEARYLAIKLMPTAEQRQLERIGRLYKLNCWFDYLGRVPRDTRSTSGAGFSHDAEKANDGMSSGGDGARPDLIQLERLHEARLKRGLESDIRHAPQGGTVKISRPAPAVRYAELRRDMADYNDKHGSYMGTGGLSRRLREQKSLNIPKPDPLEAFAQLEKSHSWQEIKHGPRDNRRRTIHRHHVGNGRGRRRAGG
jgi:hypothetical protein